jgi:hypothetical protein
LIDSTRGAAALFVHAEGAAIRNFETSRWKQIRKTEAKQASIH